MADPDKRRTENVQGAWFVDSTCIDCGTCQWMAPQVFEDRGGKAAVHRQPDHKSVDEAGAAMIACPTGSIGGPATLSHTMGLFPREIDDGVWHLGFHSRKSFGATPYLVRTKKGNVMVDVPRFTEPLARTLEGGGGVDWIVLTHRDDVADHEKWHERFGAKRIMHRDDDEIGVEKVLKKDSGSIAGLDWMHVPGHTKGSVVYRHGTTIFTGDHLCGDGVGGLRAFRNACWFDWGTQTASMEKMQNWNVTRVLPGHGAPWHGTEAGFRKAMRELVAEMHRQA